MNITETKLARNSASVELVQGVFLRDIPMAMFQKTLADHGKDKAAQKKPELFIDKVFKLFIVDKDGNEFDDIKGKKATNVLSLELCKQVVESFTSYLQPDTTKK